MGKIRAALTHLAISAVVVGSLCAVIFFVWYPGDYFVVRSGWNALKVLLGVDLVVGPLLTLIVFRTGKPSLKFDMSCIAVLQLAALGYGGWVMYQERPYFMVFAVDRFEVVGRHEIDPAAAAPWVERKPFLEPLHVVAVPPRDPHAYNQLLEETLFMGMADIERRPEFWQTYESAKAIIDRKLAPLSELAEKAPMAAERIEKSLDGLGRPAEDFGFVPLRGTERNFAVIVDRETTLPAGIVDVDPWAR